MIDRFDHVPPRLQPAGGQTLKSVGWIILILGATEETRTRLFLIYLIRIELCVIRPILVAALEIEGFSVEIQPFFDEHQSHRHGTNRRGRAWGWPPNCIGPPVRTGPLDGRFETIKKLAIIRLGVTCASDMATGSPGR